MSLQEKAPSIVGTALRPSPAPNTKTTALLTASVAFSVLAFITAAYALIDTKAVLLASPTRIICCLGFFPASLVMTRAVTDSWKSRAAFSLAVSCVNALIATIIMTHCDPLLGHAYLSLSTAGTFCYYNASAQDSQDDVQDDSYQAAAFVFCYMACVVPLWTQMERANLVQIVLNCGLVFFLTTRPTAVSRILALVITVLSSLYLMCTSPGPAGGIHLVFMTVAAELTIDYSKYTQMGQKKATHDTLALLSFICGLATLGVTLNASQSTGFLKVYLAVFLSLTVNALSATRYSDKLVHMVHTVLWSWLVSVYMMNSSYHHGIIHAMLSITTICIYNEMELSESDTKTRETWLRYVASTVCILSASLTIDIWTKYVFKLAATEDENVIMVSIVAGLFQLLFCFAPLCILDENHENKITCRDALVLFLGVTSVQIAAGLGQIYSVSYIEGILILALSLVSVGLCWLEYLKTSTPENTEGCDNLV
ncbi:hypothetical protein CJU89_1668 [Yarrowia sp. B02]|nr:hypothetical protein CJU89_1668 [Yarrowia sp. B02]